MFDPTHNDHRETCFYCSCGRAFLALPVLNPLHPPAFWDGEHVVSHCPDCGAGLQGTFYHGTSTGPADEAHTIDRGKTTSTSACPAGASCADGPGSFSPQGLAGEGSNLPASPGERIEFTFTRFRDGRIIMEDNHEAQ